MPTRCFKNYKFPELGRIVTSWMTAARCWRCSAPPPRLARKLVIASGSILGMWQAKDKAFQKAAAFKSDLLLRMVLIPVFKIV